MLQKLIVIFLMIFFKGLVMCSNYYLPLFGLLVGVGTVLITLFGLKLMVIDKIEFKGLLEERVDDLVEGLKDEIPMGRSFLSDPLVDKLKKFALNEFANLTPSMKEKIRNQMLTGSLILVGIGALFGLFMGLLAWWVCAGPRS